MTRTLAVVASLTLTVAALAPLGMTHNNETDWAFQRLFTMDKKTDGADRVSGVYYKEFSLLLGHIGPLIADNDPSFLLSLTKHYSRCDMEVLSDGSTPGNLLDEVEVDSVEGGTAVWSTLFDDGGIASACHTHAGYYAYEPYNTPGCAYDPAFAQDAAAKDIWVSTFCDYAHSTSGTGLADYVWACSYNVPTSDVNGLARCQTNVLACLTVNGIDCPLEAGFACGADESGIGGTITAGQSGWGSDGVAFESVPPPCWDGDGAAYVLVWTAVFVDTADCFAPCVEWSFPSIGIIS